MSLRVTIGTRCELGIGPDRGGRSDNQDNFLVAQGDTLQYLGPDGRRCTLPGRGHGVLVAVADGMGGHRGGEIAAAAAVRALGMRWREDLPDAGPEQALVEWIPSAHDRIRARCLAEGSADMGTTLTVLWLAGARAGWAQVGDSRLYQRRHDAVLQLTRDQTHGEFARRDGRPPRRYASYLAQSFIHGSRGIGLDGSLRLDPGVDTGTLTLAAGDRYLLCSDGVSGFLSPPVLEELLRREDGAQPLADALVEAAIAAGSDDNLTALVVDVIEVPPPPPGADGPEPGADDTLVPLD